MATTVEVERSGTWEAIDYQNFAVEVGVSSVLVAPTATVRSQVQETINPGDPLRIVVDGTTIFEGRTESGGRKQQRGGRRVKVEHQAAPLFETNVDVNETAATDESVLLAAIDAAGESATFTLDYQGSATSLGNDYAVEDRPVRQVFRDMMRRTSRVWWIDPAGTTIHVEPVGGRGTWQSIDTADGNADVVQFDEGSVDTVRNDVTVVGTGDVAVTGGAADSASISDYGRRSETINVEYITTSGEAGAMASELLVPSPLAQGEVLASSNVGDVTQPLANYTIDLTDAGMSIDATGLVVERQTIEQGQATLEVGEGSGVSIENVNRGQASREDTTAPGTVMPESRIDEDAISTPKLVDTAVIEAKLADAAVATAKLENDAVVNGKLDDFSVSETKIQDNSIATPKLQAGAVTANEIEADTITASEIAAGTITALEILADTITADEIASDTITALEISSDTITANQIDTLDLDTAALTIGADTASPLDFEIVFDGGGFSAVKVIPTGRGNVWFGDGSNLIQRLFVNIQDVNSLVPASGDNSGNVGTSGEAFSEMHAHNFVTASPDRIDAVDCGGLCDVDWYDNPPEPVRRRARELGEADDEIPDGRDHTPVELGTMANWLLETCKAQQEVIDDLTDRVADLEQAVGGGNA